jgi:uncharacterized protein CbrC (UPF0167 family)
MATTICEQCKMQTEVFRVLLRAVETCERYLCPYCIAANSVDGEIPKIAAMFNLLEDRLKWNIKNPNE